MPDPSSHPRLHALPSFAPASDATGVPSLPAPLAHRPLITPGGPADRSRSFWVGQPPTRTPEQVAREARWIELGYDPDDSRTFDWRRAHNWQDGPFGTWYTEADYLAWRARNGACLHRDPKPRHLTPDDDPYASPPSKPLRFPSEDLETSSDD